MPRKAQAVPKTWTCPRVINKKKCGWKNPRVKRKCLCCGGPKPKRRASSRDVPDVPYAKCLEMFGNQCMFPGCEVRDEPGKKLHRDHDHGTGELRGLLCMTHNYRVVRKTTWEVAQGIYTYLRGHEERMGRL